MRKVLGILAVCFMLSGCVHTPFIVQEKDKIWTLKSGAEVLVYYDNKPVKKIFSNDMFVVDKDILINDASLAIDNQLNKVNQEAKTRRMIAIVGSILGIFATALAIFVKTKGVKIKMESK